MKNLFEKSTHEELLNRLNKISPTSERKWGKMNVTEMLLHSSVPLEYALGERKGKQSLIGKIFKPFAQKTFFDEVPYKPNLPTAPEFKSSVNENDFNLEKQKLVQLLNRFHTDGAKVAGDSVHLFLGKITADEWARTMYKHLDHHLRQFGA